jgi:hypothetical protein
MPNIRLFVLAIGLGLLGAAAAACSDDAADKLSGRGGAGGGGSSGGAGGAASNPGGPPPEEVLFRALEPDFQKKCGQTCHTDGTYKPTPPTFLAGPDAYKSIKVAPNAIVADFYQSSLLQKGSHAGPAISADPTFEAKVIEWLKMEAAVIQAQKKPSTDPVALVAGPNDLDLTKACVGGLTGVHLKFDAALVGGMLSMTNLKVVAGAGTDVHVYRPTFIKVLSKPDATNRTEIRDGADTFSNTDQTVPSGAETVLTPGAAFLTAPGWEPYDFASDKVRIEFDKLEPGKVNVIEAPKVCKDVPGFTANVLPNMRGMAGGFNLNCANGGGCHANGTANLSLNNADQAFVCNQVLAKLNQADITKSIIVTKVTAGSAHNGGSINDIAGWTAVFTANRAVFF